ncbi:MAG: hypothetical protein KDE31_36835, partial [Caldilineaceae bacterium]|nr:hypothetical protein [Caldilineaceae bacterium]
MLNHLHTPIFDGDDSLPSSHHPGGLAISPGHPTEAEFSVGTSRLSIPAELVFIVADSLQDHLDLLHMLTLIILLLSVIYGGLIYALGAATSDPGD